MYKKRTKIIYLSKDIELERQVDHLPLTHYSLSVERTNTKRYHNTIALLGHLGKCARILLDFIVEEMDAENKIHNNHLLKKRFNKIIKTIGLPEYSNVTINKAFSELHKRNIVDTETEKKGTYQVNPAYFFNGSEKAREKLIRDIQEKPYKKEADAYRHRLLQLKED